MGRQVLHVHPRLNVPNKLHALYILPTCKFHNYKPVRLHLHVHMYIHIHVCLRTCIHANISHIYLNIYIYACTYVAWI